MVTIMVTLTQCSWGYNIISWNIPATLSDIFDGVLVVTCGSQNGYVDGKIMMNRGYAIFRNRLTEKNRQGVFSNKQRPAAHLSPICPICR